MFRNMEKDGLIKPETLQDFLYEKFERLPVIDDYDPLCAGEFEVIKQLLSALPGSTEAKKKIDIIIDKCGPSPKGVGIQNLRECIIETKWKYDVAAEDKQAAFKKTIINFVERYFYMICLATYALQCGPFGYQVTFNDWIKNKKELKEMIEEGKDKLEWSRTVDASKLDQLRAIMASPDYKDNLGLLVRTIYDFAFITYSDLPRGPVKNNSMKKLAASTLLEILPSDIAEKITRKLEEEPTTSHDFVTMIGLVAYF